MKLLENILLATDFSKSSNNALEATITLAKTLQSKVTLVYVLPDNVGNEKARLFLNEVATKELDVINKRIKSEGIQTANPIIECCGNHFDKIIQTADAINANVIIIGAGEKSKEDAFQLGVTAEKIIRKSHKPVFVVKNEKPLRIKKIICPVDFSLESKRALKNAITMAYRFEAELIILSVYEISHLYSIRHKINLEEQFEDIRFEHLKEFDSFLEDFNLTDLNWKKEIRSGDPATQILKAIKKYKTDLFIMGTTGKSGLSRLIMGSVTEKVIRTVPSSFITLKTEDFINLKLETRIRDIQKHYDIAKQLIKDGFFEESVNEFKICLNINDMHIPSLNGIAKVYEKMGNINKSKRYKGLANEIMNRIWDKKVEDEIRRNYKI